MGVKFKKRCILFVAFIFANCILFYLIFCLLVDLDLLDKPEDYVYTPKPPRTQHKLCIIVPYRNRFEELKEFAPYMEKFLTAQNISHQILVVNQTDNFRFNRASLINIGWNEADRLNCDYMVMNDVDLLPVNPEISYSYPEVGTIRHIASPEYHPKYHYKKFIGGILMLTMIDYRNLNGMSNKYWGWGLEDDEFYLRILESKMNLTRVAGLSTDSSNTFRHIHGPKRKRDYSGRKDKKQWDMKRKRDRISGLFSVKYTIESRKILVLSGTEVTVINVALKCDLNWTPYCKNQ